MAAILFGYQVDPIAGFVVAGGYFWWRSWLRNPRQTPHSEPPSDAFSVPDRETPAAQAPTPEHQIPPNIDRPGLEPWEWSILIILGLGILVALVVAGVSSD